MSPLPRAPQTRRLLAEMGYRSLDEVVGRTELLTLKEGAVFPKGECSAWLGGGGAAARVSGPLRSYYCALQTVGPL